MDKRLIINADDFGLCEGVNKAVAEAHTHGVLTSATIMANMPFAEDAARLGRELSGLGVGAHLNLTEGAPVSKQAEVSAILSQSGQFAYSPAKLSFLSVVSRQVRKAIETEVRAQIRWVIEHGIKPTHLDSHKHIHSFPAIFMIVRKAAEEFGIKAIRLLFEPKEVGYPPWPATSEEGRKRAAILRTMARINRMQDSSVFKTTACFGIAHTGKIDINFYRALAAYNPAGSMELMTHPGFEKGLEPAKTRLVHQRRIELESICSEKTKQYLKDAGIRLVHYGQL